MPVLNERRLLITALRAMTAVAVLAAMVLSWRYVAGPAHPEGPPSVRVVKLLPGTFIWADAPDDARYLPNGLRAREAARLKLLVLRAEDGVVRGFYLPQQDGFVGVPTTESPVTPGIPCADFAPDFRSGDIACRQAVPGFDFALRHRWSLQGRALSAGSPDLHVVAGSVVDGDWRLHALR
ncbi:MAG: hypothetical protein Q4G70_13930 [Pseudomonadota bacterium]|nr:hypothetical protein [Pseudomonadota bacterium]